MNTELIDLAKEKGFDHYILDNTFGKAPYNWYMYDLQQWLREEYNIHISVVLNYSIEYPYKPADEEYTYEESEKWVDIKDYNMVSITTPKKAYELITDTKTYEEALEKGLQTGLELI